jgi:hypothetical protein
MTRTAWTRNWPVKLAAIGLALGLLGLGSGWQQGGRDSGTAARAVAAAQAPVPSTSQEGPPWG